MQIWEHTKIGDMNVVHVHIKRNVFAALLLVFFVYFICRLLFMSGMNHTRSSFETARRHFVTENPENSNSNGAYNNNDDHTNNNLLYNKNIDLHQASGLYDWWRDFQYKAFKGPDIPDDMLAMTPPSYLPDYKNPCFFVRDPVNGKTLMPQYGNVRVSLKCLPYFHLIGVDKSGTTDLWIRLMKHRHIVPNSGILCKETHWWSWRRFGFDIWTRGAQIRHFNWYLDHYDNAAKLMMETTEVRNNTTYHPLITGEGSPTVFWDFTGWSMMPQNARKRQEEAVLTPHCLYHLNPDTKLILILRNPVDRMYSDYLFLDRFKQYHNVSAELFHEGVERSIAMYRNCVQFRHSETACLYDKTLHMLFPVRILVGVYSVWLKEWLKVFPRQQILILRNEDYSANLTTHLAKVYSFLELSSLSSKEMQAAVNEKRAFQRSASEKAVGGMLPATRQMLLEFYTPYNKELATLLDDRRFLWL